MFEELNFDAKGDQKLLLWFVSTLTGVSKIQGKRVITVMARYVLIQLLKHQKVEISHLGVFRVHNNKVLFEPCAEMKRFVNEYYTKQDSQKGLVTEAIELLLNKREVEHAQVSN